MVEERTQELREAQEQLVRREKLAVLGRLLLINLVRNAYQAMPDGGDLTINAQGKKNKVALSISDTGCGIPEKEIEKIFEPLFTTKANGIGLGLAIVKNLVDANGGTIEVESEEGKGSTFTVVLPTKEAIS